MIFRTEAELINYAKKVGENLKLPAVFELIGDVGAGKTTFTRGLARGLGVKEPVTSPSFTISNRYAFEMNEARMKVPKTNRGGTSVAGNLVHYDFYRLDDPGIMSMELEETLGDENSVVVVEWGESVKNLLPEDHYVVEFKVRDDGARGVISNL